MPTINNTGGVILKKSTSYARSFYFGNTLANVAVSASKAGGVFGAVTNSPALEIANGFYSIVLSTIDTNTAGDLAFNCSSTTSGSTTQISVWTDQVASQIFTDVSLDSGGRPIASGNLRQSTAFTNFPFTMTSGGIPAAGLTVTAQRNFGSGWVPCDNSPVDRGNGAYTINLTANDLASTAVSLLFTSGQGDTSLINIVTMP